jgi:hypothetical protein
MKYFAFAVSLVVFVFLMWLAPLACAQSKAAPAQAPAAASASPSQAAMVPVPGTKETKIAYTQWAFAVNEINRILSSNQAVTSTLTLDELNEMRISSIAVITKAAMTLGVPRSYVYDGQKNQWALPAPPKPIAAPTPQSAPAAIPEKK